MASARSLVQLTLATIAVGAVTLAGASNTTSAQDTGGSFGSSDFGGGGSDYGGGGGGSHDYGGGGGSDYGGGGGSHDYGGGSYYGGTHDYDSGDSSRSQSSGSSGPRTPMSRAAGIFWYAVILAFAGGVVYAAIWKNPNDAAVLRAAGLSSSGSGSPNASAWLRRPAPRVRELGDVSAIRIALDHHARPALQARLEDMAKRGAVSSASGRAAALHGVCTELRRNQAGWLFAHVENAALAEIDHVAARFRAASQEARTRFRIETVRSEDGVLEEQADATVRDRGEGPGIVVVTLIVAARRELVDICSPADARALNTLLVTFGSISAQDLMGLEVVWSPSKEDDRMTEPELARVYPEMVRIRDETLVGRVFCGYCSSPFARDLARCPHCGAATGDARPKTGTS